MTRQDDPSFLEFSQNSYNVLNEYRKSFTLKVANAVSAPGIWHPNGFVIWQVTTLRGLGTLRLHIWPDRDRVTRPWGPPIHRHGWHLASTVLTGTYRDTLYEDSSAQPVSGNWQQMTPYRIDILAGNRRQVIAEDEVVFIRESEVRLAPAPGFHSIPAGEFHETLIPEGEFVATLIIEGEHRGPDPLALEETRHPPRTHQRELLDPEGTARMIENLKNRIVGTGSPG